jgi:hypothetical protein
MPTSPPRISPDSLRLGVLDLGTHESSDQFPVGPCNNFLGRKCVKSDETTRGRPAQVPTQFRRAGSSSEGSRGTRRPRGPSEGRVHAVGSLGPPGRTPGMGTARGGLRSKVRAAGAAYLDGRAGRAGTQRGAGRGARGAGRRPAGTRWARLCCLPRSAAQVPAWGGSGISPGLRSHAARRRERPQRCLHRGARTALGSRQRQKYG